MRTKRTLLNLAYTLGSSLILLLLGLVTRRLLVYNFGESIAASASVVEKLFNFFSIAEFGVGSVISYRLYEQLAVHDNEKISLYMSLYKWAYRAVAGVITVLAAVFALALPFIMPQTPLPTVYMVYGLHFLSTISGYFLVTRRLLYTCTQQGYLCTQTDLLCNIASYLLRIAVAMWWPNYVLYYGVTILCNVAANLIVARRYRHDFPAVHDVPVTLADFKNLGVFHDLRHYLVHRLSNTVYGSSDTIVTSMLAGERLTQNLGNYTTLSDSATNLGNKIMDSFAAAIGNIVYDPTAEADGHARQVFWGVDLFSYLFGSFVATAYLCLFQPFISVWMGEDFLLPFGFVVVFSLNEYVGWNHRMLGSYRAVLGRFEEDERYMVASAALNLVLSFALFVPLGITGILAATVIAHAVMWVGRARVVCRHYMRGAGARYLRVQLIHLATLAADMAAAWAVCALLPGGWAGVALRFAVAAVLPNAMNAAFYLWTPDAAYLRGRAGELLAKLKNRGAA